MLDPDSFGHLYEEHRGTIVRYLRRRLGDEAAEDAAADTFRWALRSLPDDRARFRTPLIWLYSIATEVIAQRWGSELHRRERLERLSLMPPAAGPGLPAPRPLDARIIGVLRELPAVDRETVLLSAWAGLSYDDVAHTFGAPPAALIERLTITRTAMPEGLEVEELIEALRDNADLGLDPIRQPMIESAVNRRTAADRHYRRRPRARRQPQSQAQPDIAPAA